MTMSGGIPWDEQGAEMNLAEYLPEFRQGVESALKAGPFDIKDMDHNSPRYAGFSNKRARIAAVKLDPSCKGKDFNTVQFWVVWRAAFAG